jgi:hypothetical protein
MNLLADIFNGALFNGAPVVGITEGDLWIDTSNERPVMKAWVNGEWVVKPDEFCDGCLCSRWPPYPDGWVRNDADCRSDDRKNPCPCSGACTEEWR